MLKAFVNAFKIPDLRKKILFTVAIIAVFRLGSSIPAPNIDLGALFNQPAPGKTGSRAALPSSQGAKNFVSQFYRADLRIIQIHNIKSRHGVTSLTSAPGRTRRSVQAPRP